MTDILNLDRAVRKGEWLELPLPSFSGSLDPALPPRGEHPHAVRKWLLSLGQFPEKWINRLFSVGGIRLHNNRLMLRMFGEIELSNHSLYAAALASIGQPVPPVLYEDDHCLVMNKPAGMPVHPPMQGSAGSLDEAVLRHALLTGQAVPIRHIHRLDEDTSGPVLYAKNDLAQLRLDEAMSGKQIERGYIALVQGRLIRKHGSIDLPIGRDRHHSARRRVAQAGDRAVTHYDVVESYISASLVRIRLETGRTHQIRVHFSHIGHALVGDKLYGGGTQLLSHQALHGETLIFPHPWNGRQVQIRVPCPEWFEHARQRLSAEANS